MKAYVLHKINDIRYEDVEYPSCPPDWAIVRVKAAGICSSDIPRILTKGTYHYPLIPGHEFSGIVEKVSNSDKNGKLVGKRVSVFPLIPCFQCQLCQNHQYEMCEHYDYIGSRRDGAFAEYVSVPIWNLLELPDDINFEEAAMLEPLAVSLHAVKQMDIKETDDVAIIGTGMIAFASAQLALLLGAKSASIIARSNNKKKIADSLSNVKYISDPDCSLQFEKTLEAVGSNQSIRRCIELTKPKGKIVLMGNPEGDIILQQDVYWRILRKQITVSGTWNSSYDNGSYNDWLEMLSLISDRRIDLHALITHTFHQSELNDALRLMKEHIEPYCKVMTLWNEE